MKHIFLSLIFIITLLMVSGCGPGKATPGGQAAPSADFTRDDLMLTINSMEYRCNMNIESVVADLGADYEYAEGMSCDYDGLDKSYLYGVAHFYTSPLSEGDLINEIYTEDPAVSTSRGITVGATKEEILSAYGEDCEDLDDLLIYRLPGERPALCFELEDDVVWAIYLTTQPV